MAKGIIESMTSAFTAGSEFGLGKTPEGHVINIKQTETNVRPSPSGDIDKVMTELSNTNASQTVSTVQEAASAVELKASEAMAAKAARKAASLLSRADRVAMAEARLGHIAAGRDRERGKEYGDDIK